MGLRAERIVAGATIVEISTPIGGVGALDVITVGVLGHGLNVVDGGEGVIGVDDLKVAEVAGLSEAIAGKMTGTHLCGGVFSVGARVDHLPTPFHHGRMLSKVCE